MIIELDPGAPIAALQDVVNAGPDPLLVSYNQTHLFILHPGQTATFERVDSPLTPWLKWRLGGLIAKSAA